jgi:two-component sensor histidine kinase
LSEQFFRVDKPDGLKQAIEGRLQALANVHTLFVQSRWTGADLHSLVTQELSPFRGDGEPRVRTDGPNLMLEPNAAQAIAVTLHDPSLTLGALGRFRNPHKTWIWGCQNPKV